MDGYFAQLLRRTRLIAILRNVPNANLEPLATALTQGGIQLIEIALSGPNSTIQLDTLQEKLPGHVMIGAGTVTSHELAASALAAGAQFFITPHVIPTVIEFANQNEVGIVCGALTPTEIIAAKDYGSDFIKVFPACAVGSAYFSALLGPYPGLELVAVGGINQENLHTYLGAGAVAAGIGGALTKLDWNEPDYQRVESLAAQLTSAAQGVKAR